MLMLIPNKSKLQCVICLSENNRLLLATEKILTEFTKKQALKFAEEIKKLYAVK